MTDIIYSGDQLATIASFRTRAGELADLLETIPDEKHDQKSYAELDRNEEGNLCATPHCALGWAIDRGLVPDTSLTLLAHSNSFYARNAPKGKEFKTSSIYGESVNPLYEVPSEFAYGIGAKPWPVRGNEYFNFDDVGLEHYGSVVFNEVFYDVDGSKEEIIAKLREYAKTGEIRRLEPGGENGELVPWVAYHDPDNDLDRALCEVTE